MLSAASKPSPLVTMPLNGEVVSLAANEVGAAAAMEGLAPLPEGRTIGVQGPSIAANLLDKHLMGAAEIRGHQTTEQHDLDLPVGRINAIMASTACLCGTASKAGNEEMTLAGRVPTFLAFKLKIDAL